MGKHEANKSTGRVARHRAAMRARGLRLKQVWTPDASDPAVLAAIAKANRLIASHPEEEAAALAWIESVTSGAAQAEPDYRW